MKIVAVDCGLTGGVVLHDSKGFSMIEMPIEKMNVPKDAERKIDVIKLQEVFIGATLIIIEEQFPLKNQGAKSTFTTARNYEAIITVARLMKIPYKLVSTKVWQKFYSFSQIKYKTTTLKKKAHIEEAKRILVKLRIGATIKKDGIADAFLMLHHHQEIERIREHRKKI